MNIISIFERRTIWPSGSTEVTISDFQLIFDNLIRNVIISKINLYFMIKNVRIRKYFYKGMYVLL